MIGSSETHPGDAADSAETAQRVVELRRQGLRFSEIGAHLGFTKQYANKVYWDTVRAIPVQQVEAHRAEQVDEITEVIRTGFEVMNAAHYAHSQGKVVLDPDTGAKLVDDAPRLDAARTIIAAHARLAKLLGLDAPVSSVVQATVNYTVGGGIDPDKDLT